MRLNVGKAADYLREKKKDEGGGGQLVGLLMAEHELGIELRRPFEQMWLLNLAYLMSKQYTFFNATVHQLQHLLRKPGERRIVDNQLLPKWRRQVADLIKNDPEMSVVPNTTEEEDLQAAKIGDKVLKFWWRNGHMKRTIRQLAVWIYSTGNGFLQDVWDPAIGPYQVQPETGKLVYEGDVKCNLWSPFEVVTPAQGLFSGELNDLPWIEIYTWRTLSWMKGFFGEKAVEDVAPEIRSHEGITLATLFGGTSERGTELTKGAMLHEFMVRPCGEFPKGLHCYMAGRQVLYKEDYPFDYYPIEHFKDIEIAGSFWGAATTEHAIQLQNRWNRALNSIDTFNETMAKGKWISPKGANLEANPTNAHGEFMTYTPVMGHKPEHVSVKGLPGTYDLILMSTRTSLENLYSQHEVTRGTNKSDIRSGDMLEILREQDAHGNIPSHMVFEEALEKLASRVLKRIQRGYTTERTVKIPGKDSQWDVMAFKGADLRGNTDVSVKRQSSLPDSRAARHAQILQRFGQGLYGNPADPNVRREVMNMLDDAVMENVFADTRLDETVARNENMILLQNQASQLLVNGYDNHRLHLMEHNHFRKTHDYQTLKFNDPKLFMILEGRFEEHIQQHQEFVMEEEERMIAQQRALKGGE